MNITKTKRTEEKIKVVVSVLVSCSSSTLLCYDTKTGSTHVLGSSAVYFDSPSSTESAINIYAVLNWKYQF